VSGYVVEVGGGVASNGGGVTEQTSTLAVNHPTHVCRGVLHQLLGVSELLVERLTLHTQRRHQTISFRRQLRDHLQRSHKYRCPGMAFYIPTPSHSRASDSHSFPFPIL